MRKNLFIAASPLQVVNAIEAKYHFNIEHSVLILIHSSIEANSIQMEALLQMSHFDTVIHVQNRYRSKISKIFEQKKLIKELQKDSYEYAFSGDYGLFQEILLANLNISQIYLLDDGALTLTTHASKLAPGYKRNLNRRIKSFRYTLLGLKTHQSKIVNLFTTFNLKSHDKEIIIHNDFTFFKTCYLEKAIVESSLYLLGQPLVRSNLLSESTYITYIQSIIKNYHTKIIYIPHRKEIITNTLRSLESDNFCIKESKGPIEILFLSQYIYPKNIVSFYSSALFNLKKIFENAQIDAIQIHPNDLLRGHDPIAECYRELKNSQINIIDLNINQ